MNLNDDLVQISGFGFTPLDQAINNILLNNNISLPTDLVLTGGSGKGWSYTSTFQRCPRAFYYKYVDLQCNPIGIPPAALEIGGLLHALLAIYYHSAGSLALAKDFWVALGGQNITPQHYAEGWRLFDAYVNYYGDNDYIEPLAVEYTCVEPKTGNSCRYDLIARVNDKAPRGITPGVYIIEHKTTASYTEDIMMSFLMDGEIRGQLLLWKRLKLEKKFGKLEGVLINMIGKQKTPKFERFVVEPSETHMDKHLKDLKFWNARIKAHKKADNWPKALTGCMSRFGRCQYFDYCLGEK